MKIFALSIAKNEADIIEQCFDAALDWADGIFAVDNGSDDDTWQLIEKMAASDDRVRALGCWDEPFSESVRGRIFEQAHRVGRAGDWWCRLDADEFYIDDPRGFLAAVPRARSRVWSSSFEYYFTDVDSERFAADPDHFSCGMPIEQTIRHYLNNYGELRFVRHEKMLRGHRSPTGRDWPSGWPVTKATDVHQTRIRLRHYQYRSPRQIESRLATRRAAVNSGGAFQHEDKAGWIERVVSRQAQLSLGEQARESADLTWRDRVVPARLLHREETDCPLVESPELLGALPTRRSSGLVRRTASRLRPPTVATTTVWP
jgi:hypothetical protein